MPAEGFLLVDKPGGWTSHDVVAKVRGLAATRKVGHAGTLDPMATGLLVLGLGRATRLLRFVQEAPKEYVARAQFGIATDSLDADGTETERSPMSVTGETVAAALDPFLGDIQQIPPMTSAIKIGGQKLYELARRGEEIERPPRAVHIFELELLAFEAGDFPVVDFRVVCSSGTYVRTLADDIARALGGRAHLVGLRRTRIGTLHVDDAVAMDELVADRDGVETTILALSEGLADLSRITVDDDLGRRISHGSVLSPAELPIDQPTAVLDEDGNLLAVYTRREAEVRPEVVLA
ncbi:MAG: tRNA pseudouridine(55) synthase TruB [Acidimicrobiia bacterium]|nr:tRNA pseudouridine(55) synthase TruB [Acidimicrobiia bacterium]